MALSAEFLKRYDFDWEVLDVIIGGASAIDTANMLRIRTQDGADRFLECYGYESTNPIEKAELFGNYQEALSFIRRFFLQPDNAEGLKIDVPRKLLEMTDISQLLLMANPQGGGPSSTATSLWACAIIKVMHTIAHMDKDLRTSYFPDIQKQVLDRFYKYIHRDEGGLYLGIDSKDPDRVELSLFETKPKKSRDSVLLKLLHKSGNVAEDIFDRVGIRFVTKNKFDAIRIVKFLKDRHVMMAANIKPGRSRNNLVDPISFKIENAKLIKLADSGQLAPGEVYRKLVDFCESNVPQEQNQGEINPHTSKHYRGIQFTGRQLVKISNPLYDDIKMIKQLAKADGSAKDLMTVAERIDLKNLQKEIRFFYPFEVQIFDEASHQENMAGRSSHVNYKKSQVQTAMKRVLGELIRFAE